MKKTVFRLAHICADKILLRTINAKFASLRTHYSLNFEKRSINNINSLYSIVNNAQKHVPYYRNEFSKIGFRPEEIIHDQRALTELPILTKEIILEQGIRLCDERYVPLPHKRVSFASIGPQIVTYWDNISLDWAAATNIYYLSIIGKEFGDKEVYIYSCANAPKSIKQRIFEYAKCSVLCRKNIFIDNYSEESLAKLWKKLCDIRPRVVFGDSSTLYSLANYVEQLSRKDNPFEIFINTREKLEEKKRIAIDLILGCKTYDSYGVSEFGVVAHETNNNRASGALTLLDHQVWAEDEYYGDNLNELVFTGLTNTVMPLIRYKFGDFGRVERAADGIKISMLERRINDVICINGQHYPTSHIHAMLSRIHGFKDFHVTIDNNGVLCEITIVMQGNIQHKEIIKMLNCIPDNIKINICNLNTIPQNWKNRFRNITKNEYIEHKQQICVTSISKKILIICHSLAINGANNHVREFISLFKNVTDFDILAVSEGPMREVFESLGVNIYIFSDNHMLDLSKYICVIGNTLMTTHILVKIIGKIPVLLTVHEAWHPDSLQQHIDAFEFGNIISEETIKKVLYNADKIIFPASFQKSMYAPLLSTTKNLHNIYCTVSLSDINLYCKNISQKEARKKIGVKQDTLIFIQVGTITKRKNQINTVRAFNIFLKRNQDINAILILLGARRSRKNESQYVDIILNECRKYEIDDRIFVINTVPTALPYIRAADIMVHPSLNEVLPLAILEAGACGLPVIASQRDGLPEIIKNGVTGYLVNPTSIDEIALKMEKFARDKHLRERLGNNLKQKVAIQHAPEKFKEQWKNILGLN